MAIKKYDYCFFCGKKVIKTAWREHMKIQHRAVLQNSPKDKRGRFKKVEREG